jgi:peptidoglycan/LPS O-acetylase OafA/YrhL
VAILLVLIGHAGASYRIGSVAAAGVTLFFALSGYLITGILQTEYERHGQIKLRHFYTRRLTRLGPPLLIMVLLTGPVLRPGWDAVIPALTWTGNYAGLAGVDLGSYGHTWSLGVEEQFYIAWPLALLALIRLRGRLVTVVLWVVLALIAWRTLLTAAGELRYAYTAVETAGTAILGGCLVALARWRLPGRWAAFSLAGMLCVALAVAASSMWWVMWLVVPLLVTPMAVVLVAAAQDAAWLEMKWLTTAGVTSYSVYLWHQPISHLISGTLSPLGVAAGALVGIAAYAGAEAPLMSWRSAREAVAHTQMVGDGRPPATSASGGDTSSADAPVSSAVRLACVRRP